MILLGPLARADLMPSTGAERAPNFAEITVLEDRVRVAVEIDPADYPAFVPGAPEGAALAADGEPDPAALSRQAGVRLTIQADDGQPITPRVRLVEVRDRKPRLTATRAAGSVIPSAPPSISPRVIYAELEYPLSRRPERLTFVPPLDADGAAPVALGFLASHGRVPITDYRFLSVAETLRLDWADPWYSAFENPNLTRHHKSPLMSFISIEPREVRHEIIFRLRDLEGWTALELGDARTLDAELMAKVRQAAESFFAARNPVIVDGEARDPASARVELLDVGVTGLQIIEDPKGLDRATALLGIVLSYPVRRLPQQLAMIWQIFPEGGATIPVQVIDPAGGAPAPVTPADPEVTWTNFLTDWQEPSVEPVRVDADRTIPIPILSVMFLGLGCVSAVRAVRGPARWRGAGLGLLAGLAAFFLMPIELSVSLPVGKPDGATAAAISNAMLENAATAMLETEPASFEEALSSFVSRGDRAAVGAEMQRGLSVTLPSGARARTDAVGALTVEDVSDRRDGLSVLASLTSRVSGGHWGHLHRRNVKYRALMDVVEEDGVWRLEGLTVLSARIET